MEAQHSIRRISLYDFSRETFTFYYIKLLPNVLPGSTGVLVVCGQICWLPVCWLQNSVSLLNVLLLGVDKKNQLDFTFCILYFSSNSCSTCFGQPCAHHQELTTA